MTTIAISKIQIENGLFSISRSQIIRFWRNFCAQMRIMIPRMVAWREIKIFQIQDGGRTLYWKSFFGYISMPYCLINAKFRVRKQNHMLIADTSCDQNSKFGRFKIADDRHFENVFLYISTANCPISMKFGMQMRGLIWKMVMWAILQFWNSLEHYLRNR